MRRIRQSELQLHQPLPWSLYDSQGNLLLRQGFVLSIPRHVDMLLHRGVYVHDEDDGMPAATATGAAAMVSSLHAEPARGGRNGMSACRRPLEQRAGRTFMLTKSVAG